MKHPALAHIQEALNQIVLEAYRENERGEMLQVSNLTIAEELRRVDCAIGPKGESMFGRLADVIDAVFVELLAAKKELDTN